MWKQWRYKGARGDDSLDLGKLLSATRDRGG